MNTEREPTDWERAPQSTGYSFEGTMERLRFATARSSSGRGPSTRLTPSFWILIVAGATAVVVVAAVFG